MNFIAKTEDHLIGPQGGAPRGGRKDFFVAFAASLVVNAAVLSLMIWESARDKTPNMQETAVEVIVEAPPPEVAKPDVEPESTEASPPRANANAHLRNGGLPEIADEDREQKAPKGEETIYGAGVDKIVRSAPQAAQDRREGEEADPDPNKEISRIIPPAAPMPVPTPKPIIAPPGTSKQRAAQRKSDKVATHDEAAMKDKKIECSGRGYIGRPTHQVMQALVLGQLTKEQAARVIKKTQISKDLFINQNYVNNVRIFVHSDGSPDGDSKIVLLPQGLSVRAGDRIEYITGYPDPATPCHYIPNVVSRVL